MSATVNGKRSRRAVGPAATSAINTAATRSSGPPNLNRGCIVVFASSEFPTAISFGEDQRAFDDLAEAAEYAKAFNRFSSDDVLSLAENRAYLLVEADVIAKSLTSRSSRRSKGGA